MLGGRMESRKKKTVGESGNGRFLQEIEALSKALSINRNQPRGFLSSASAAAVSSMRSISAGKTHPHENPKTNKPRAFKEIPNASSNKDKKSSSIWNWKPLRALSHIRNRRFNCSFSLEVHCIDHLPPDFNGASLRVHWKRRDGGLETQPARVFQGIAEFGEILTYKCSVYGTGNGPHHSAKYEAKHFLLYASVVGAAELDLGKHRIDLTRLLPLTLEELEEEKSSGKWATSFKLSGKAKGATLNVSFGFLVLGDDSVGSSGNKKAPEYSNMKLNRVASTKPAVGYDLGSDRGSLRRFESLPGTAHAPREQSHLPSRSIEDVKILHEVLPTSKSEVTSSFTIEQALMYEKLDDAKFDDALVDDKPEFQVFSEDDPLSKSTQENCEIGCDDTDFTVIEQGIQVDTKEEVKLEEDMKVVCDLAEESIELSDCNKVIPEDIIKPGAAVEKTSLDEFADDNTVVLEEVTNPGQQAESDSSYKPGSSLVNHSSKEDNLFTKELVMEELDSAFCNLSIFEGEEFESPHSQSRDSGKANNAEVKSNYKMGKMGKSLSLDDVTESVASEFLSMLNVEHSPLGLSSDSDPESPREQLWRQFKKESLAGNGGVFGLDVCRGMEAELVDDAPVQFDLGDLSDDFELSSMIHAAETEHHRANQAMKSKTRAEVLEDAETEALMREWGLNEKAFQSSPPAAAGGFGSPIHLPQEEPFDLPPLAEGLGPYVQTKDGGFLRSMNPLLFSNAKNNGSLVMQVSSPVVVPAEMGSGVMEILQQLASIGVEKLSVQASKLMPLEDINGVTMQQLAWEAAPSLEGPARQDLLHHLKPEGAEVGHDVISGRRQQKGAGKHRSKMDLSSSSNTGSEYFSLEDLAPLAMDKIEALSVEGLRIQSGMSDEEAPSNICPQSIGEISALEGMRAKKSGSLGLEGTAGLQLLDIKDGGNEVDGLMGLSISLDEWMRLDSGIVDEEEQNSSRTSKILAAHHATCTDLTGGGWTGDKRGGKNSGRRWGLLGNNFTVALMVQLRDPLRNYEPVGSPMLSLIQVERVFVPPKPKIYSTVSEKGNSEEADEEPAPAAKEEKKVEEEKEKEKEVELIPQFKITEVHVAGLKTEPSNKKLWGSSTQQQSGSRWLLAAGMGKSNKHPFMKAKTASKSPQVSTTTVQPGDTLWSISARIHGDGSKWKELAALNPHIRNPNVIFPNEKIRLR